MKWTLKGDDTEPVITAEKHVRSSHRAAGEITLPQTCVIFETGMAVDYLKSVFQAATLVPRLPCFLGSSECVAVPGHPEVCFVRGGYGAPAAVDTLETVRALGARRLIIAGLCGGFSPDIRVSDVVIPHKILSEEGTSRHYYEDVDFVLPDEALFRKACTYFSGRFPLRTEATVTSDSVYRQTFAKEAFWRSKGCIGVDMEASALLAVSRFYAMPAAAVLLCSDRHPLSPEEASWDWGDPDFPRARERFVEEVVRFSLQLQGIHPADSPS